MTRLLAADVQHVPLTISLPAGTEITAGAPGAAAAELAEFAGTEVGIWEMTEGAARDVEADEVFLVVAGHATLRFADAETLDLLPGVLVRLHAGEHTEWIVHQTLRKVYLTPAAS